MAGVSWGDTGFARLGIELDLIAEYKQNHHVTYGFGLAHLFTGQFLKEATRGKDYNRRRTADAAAKAGLVASMVSRHFLIASGASSAMTITGPSAMKSAGAGLLRMNANASQFIGAGTR